MCCNSFDEQTILLSLFGNRALYLIGSASKIAIEYWRVPVSGLEFIDHYWTTKVRSEVPFSQDSI